VESKDQLYLDIKAGKWDQVLRQTFSIALPSEVLIELYEQIIFEMKEIGEQETCMTLFKKAVLDL
jgi:hypothetical protein